jgi:phage FluMu gp28-like protein
VQATQAVHGKAPLGIVKRNEQEFIEWASTERGFMQVFGRYDEQPIKFEPYQLAFLKTKAHYRCVEKARQVGYSWLFACESVARSHLRETHTTVFVSYNLADAKEKILYCHQMHEELPLEYQKKLVVESKLELGFRSNNARARVSRIISNPSKAPRGKKGDIYLDELAHCTNDRDIYKGSTALILRAASQLTVCSSPLGRRGSFWEIARQEVRPYRSYWRQSVPWWLCSFLSKDVRAASKVAQGMNTPDRVEKFGTKALREQFDSLAIEDFQQEYEVFYSDETMTFFPFDLILGCTSPEHELYDDLADVFKNCKGRLVCGFDIGRRKDLSVIVIFEEQKDGSLRLVYMKVMDREPFDKQEAEARGVLNTLGIARFSIDETGLGMHLADNLSKDFPQVVREKFSEHSKEVWCNDFKILLQRKMLELPRDRDLISQIHSIKKIVTAGGHVKFDADTNSKGQKGHADKFWACALAVRKERGELRSPGQVHVRVFG